MKTKFTISILFIAIISSFSCFEMQSQNNDNEKIKSFIFKKKEFNKKFGFGFRIQLYNGSERQVKSSRARFRVEFPETKTYLSYEAPEWKVQVGNYKTRLEADKALLVIQPKFSNAIVIPLGK